MKNKKKLITTVVALALVLVCAVGATLAYITTKTEKVTNTFTVGDVSIDLDEPTADEDDFKLVPGNVITKDPTVTVEKGSEASYLFVKVETTNDFDTYVDYSIADGWTALGDAYPGVYYMVTDAIPSTGTDASYSVLTDNKVTVKADLTKDQLDAIGNNLPTLSFTAYAVQKDNIADAVTAWAQVKDL